MKTFDHAEQLATAALDVLNTADFIGQEASDCAEALRAALAEWERHNETTKGGK